MSLEISNYNNHFKVKGVLTRQNVAEFNSEFRNIFKKFNAITVSIEGLSNIDRYGVNALAQLHNAAITQGKSLSIIGMGCDDLYEHFKAEESVA